MQAKITRGLTVIDSVVQLFLESPNAESLLDDDAKIDPNRIIDRFSKYSEKMETSISTIKEKYEEQYDTDLINPLLEVNTLLAMDNVKKSKDSKGILDGVLLIIKNIHRIFAMKFQNNVRQSENIAFEQLFKIVRDNVNWLTTLHMSQNQNIVDETLRIRSDAHLNYAMDHSGKEYYERRTARRLEAIVNIGRGDTNLLAETIKSQRIFNSYSSNLELLVKFINDFSWYRLEGNSEATISPILYRNFFCMKYLLDKLLDDKTGIASNQITGRALIPSINSITYQEWIKSDSTEQLTLLAEQATILVIANKQVITEKIYVADPPHKLPHYQLWLKLVKEINRVFELFKIDISNSQKAMLFDKAGSEINRFKERIEEIFSLGFAIIDLCRWLHVYGKWLFLQLFSSIEEEEDSYNHHKAFYLIQLFSSVIGIKFINFGEDINLWFDKMKSSDIAKEIKLIIIECVETFFDDDIAKLRYEKEIQVKENLDNLYLFLSSPNLNIDPTLKDSIELMYIQRELWVPEKKETTGTTSRPSSVSTPTDTSRNTEPESSNVNEEKLYRYLNRPVHENDICLLPPARDNIRFALAPTHKNFFLSPS